MRLKGVKQRLQSRGWHYGDVAALAGVSIQMVHYVVRRRKHSPVVDGAIRALLSRDKYAVLQKAFRGVYPIANGHRRRRAA